MLAVITFLLVLVVSIVVTKVATVALTHTGVSRELARFQARSAFTGVGFTTTEAERVVAHPVRRRILMLLMLLGNAGIVTAISTLILTFAKTSEAGASAWVRLALLIGGIAALWTLSSSQLIDRLLSRLVARALKRWTEIEVRDYANLLHLAGEYKVKELEVEEDDWLTGQSLRDLKLTDEGVLVLAVQRLDGRFVGAPVGETRFRPGDVLILYGRDSVICDLDERRAGYRGDLAHAELAARHREMVEDGPLEAADAAGGGGGDAAS